MESCAAHNFSPFGCRWDRQKRFIAKLFAHGKRRLATFRFSFWNFSGERGPDFLNLPGVAPRMQSHHQEHFITVCGSDQGMGCNSPAEIRRQAPDEPHRPFPAGEKMLQRRGQRGKLPPRSHRLGRFEAERTIERPLRNQRLALRRDGRSLCESRIPNLRKKIIFRDGDVLHAVENRPFPGAGRALRQSGGNTAQRVEQVPASALEQCQHLPLFPRIHRWSPLSEPAKDGAIREP